MKYDFCDLIEALNKQKEIYQDLLDLSYEKQKVIIGNDTQRLNEIVQEEIKFLSFINKAEGNRLESVAACAADYGLESKEMTLSHLIELAENAQKEELRRLKQELGSLFTRQGELNKVNQKLLETHLEYTETMINVLLSSEDPLNNFYSEDGSAEKGKKQKSGLFDQQA